MEELLSVPGPALSKTELIKYLFIRHKNLRKLGSYYKHCI